MLDLNVNADNIFFFLLVMVRISTIIFAMPIFGADFLPRQWKVALALLLTVVTCIMVKKPGMLPEEPSMAQLFLLAGKEVVLGLLVGLTAGFIFFAVQLWGQVIGTQMGLGLANVVDPQSGTNMSIISQFYYMFALVLFMSVNGHHMLISGMIESFDYFPPGVAAFPSGGISVLVEMSGKVFVIAVQLASSMMVLLLLVSVSLGIIARTVPQMNIFIVGIPLKLFVGLLGMVITIPYISRAMIDLFRKIPSDIATVLGAG